MYISRLMVLCLFIALYVAPVAAQSPAESNSAFSPSGTNQRAVVLPPNTQGIPRYSSLQAASPEEDFKLPDSMHGATVQERESGAIPRLEFRVPRAPIVVQNYGVQNYVAQNYVAQNDVVQNDEACYTIRSYRVTRDDPRSDSTRLAGYSTCQHAARFQVRQAVDSLEVVPR
jgi:hypothetical protein